MGKSFIFTILSSLILLACVKEQEEIDLTVGVWEVKGKARYREDRKVSLLKANRRELFNFDYCSLRKGEACEGRQLIYRDGKLDVQRDYQYKILEAGDILELHYPQEGIPQVFYRKAFGPDYLLYETFVQEDGRINKLQYSFERIQ